MKKFIYLVIIFFLYTSNQAFSQTIPNRIYTVTEKDLNTSNIEINHELTLLSFDNYNITKDINIKKGDKLILIPIEYKIPKRGKRNGYYKVKIIKIIYKDNTYIFEKNIIAKMRSSNPKDFKTIAKSAGVTITGHILKVPGFSQVIAASKGLIKPNEGENRLQSAGKNLYKSTPLTYIEKGEDFSAEKDSIIVLKFKYNN